MKTKGNLFLQYEKREVRNAYLFLLPILLAILVFILYPVLGTLWSSFFDKNGIEWVWFENYGKVLGTSDFWQALKFTLLFALATIFFESLFGLLFALLLNETFKGRGILRAVVLIPWAIPTIISARIWQVIYNYSYGVLNHLAVNLGFIPEKMDWLGTSTSAFWSLVIADVWKTTPFVVIILLAGLQAIPGDIYKQARVDGAKMFKRFSKITLPLVMPVLAIAMIFRTIDAIRIFDLVYALTGGGPGGATETLSYLGYEAFNQLQMGRFSAISVLTFVISFAITIIYVKAGKFGESVK